MPADGTWQEGCKGGEVTMGSRDLTVRETLPGRKPGTYYDEFGNEVAVRADMFNSLPASRKPRIYDHRGLRVVRLDTGPRVVSTRPTVAKASDGMSMLVALWRAMVGAIGLFLKVVLLLARLV